MSLARIAVLLFTRSAGEEALHKRFVSWGTRASNAAVASQLIGHATATAQRAAVDVVCVDSSQQTGSTFGERLAGAVGRVFELGYTHLLVIGNDCPQLDEHLLRRAAAAVQQTGAVLGPATDGGVYLLGISRALFETSHWLALPWQTEQLGRALAQQLRQQGAAVCLLPSLADIDDEQDLAPSHAEPAGRLAAAPLAPATGRPATTGVVHPRVDLPLPFARGSAAPGAACLLKLPEITHPSPQRAYVVGFSARWAVRVVSVCFSVSYEEGFTAFCVFSVVFSALATSLGAG